MTASYLWLIPCLPLFSAALIRWFGRWLLPRTVVHALACLSVFASFVLSVSAFLALTKLHGEGAAVVQHLYSWIRVGTMDIGASFIVDPLSAVMILVVTGVGFLIHLYSTGYMAHEEEFERYFAYLNLFTAMMLILVLADNMLLMFVGWEGVGLCSYLLIGFWFRVKENCNAGKKAFVVNRIGDFGFIIGMLLLFWTLGLDRGIWSLDFAALRENAEVFSGATVFGVSVVVLATLMLFVGATGKSAQIPLYVWLPDAMAGPTPVSALIHAATMVTAGVYMIARLSFLYDMAPFSLTVVAIVGGLTALYSATVGLAQNDIKKVLAYSTVSQLGYMFLACGVGAYASGVFHLMTHAFFKALLFLGSGSVIHAMSGEQDIRKMGGLRKKIPITYWTFLIGTLAITGFPFLSGFFSKDEILWQAFNRHPAFWVLGFAAAILTSFYMFRLVFMTFHGECRASDEVKHHIHESPASMTIPLILLAVLSIVGGYFWAPFGTIEMFPHWLESAVVVHHPHGHWQMELGLMLASVVVAFGGGLWLARRFYLLKPECPGQIAMNWPATYRLILNKYFVDEIYGRVFVEGTKRVAALCFWFDKWIVDGIVNGSAWLFRGIVWIEGRFDKWGIDFLVNLTGSMTLGLGRRVRKLQTGQIQNYLGVLAGAVVLITLVWMSFVIGA